MNDVDAGLTELRASLRRGRLITDPNSMESYRRDHAAIQVEPGQPRAVALPATTAEVQAVVRFAAAHNLPIVPRGSGTGLSAGSTAVDGCIVLSTEKLTSMHIHRENRAAVVGAGVLNTDLKEAAAEAGLWYPPDPASYEICTIGGNVATNAGGLCCAKYGVTRNYVLGLRVVLPDGSCVQLGGPLLKDVSGLGVAGLFIGSEGTLGIITEVTLRLVPPQRSTNTLVAIFASVEAAASAVTIICQQITPTMLELLDRVTINAVEDFSRMGLDRTAGAMLLAQTDTPGDEGAAELAFMEEVANRNNAQEIYETQDAQTGAELVQARRLALPALEAQGTVLLDDVGVPLSQLSELVRRIEDIARVGDTTIALVAHAADGNTHPIIVYNPSAPGQKAQAESAFASIMETAIDLGGTITGEHGVGRLKKPWMAGNLGPEAMSLNRRIKNTLDPAGIMNPGVKF